MKLAAAVLILGALQVPARAATPAEWTEAQAPFRIAGHLYYVGNKGLASYLVTTSGGK